jgi:hypothetical protein
MTGEVSKELIELIDEIGKQIEIARKLSLQHTALLLSMARLDVQMKAYTISEDELQAFYAALENPKGVAPAKQRLEFTVSLPPDTRTVSVGMVGGLRPAQRATAETLFKEQDRRHPRTRRRLVAVSAARTFSAVRGRGR